MSDPLKPLVLVIDDYDFGPCRANAEQWLALFQAGLPLGLRGSSRCDDARYSSSSSSTAPEL